MSLPSLTTHNHSSFIASHALVLVLYASPWCAHRQRLLPTLATAAAALPDNVAIALCEEPALAEAAGVVEMPSLRLHRPDDDDVPEPFEQDTPEDDEAGAIADYLLRSSRTAPLQVTSREALDRELSSAERLGGVTAVLFGAELDGAAEVVASMRHVARQAHWRGRVALALADARLARHFGGEAPCEAPCLALYRGADTAAAELHVPAAELPALAEWEHLRALLARHAQPLLAQIGPHNYAEYAGTGRPLAYLFLNSSCCADANRRAKQAAAAAAATHRGALSFVWLDGERYSHHARALGAAAGALPVVAAEAHEAHYVYDGPVDDGAALATWAAAVLEGRLRSTLRSATPPLVSGGPVVVAVAATFETLVLRAPTAVLLFVHAPWCAECDAIAAEVEALAAAWHAERTLRVASFDVGANDLPRWLAVRTLPALLLFPARRAPTAPPHDLSEARTAAALSEQLRLLQPALRAPLDTAHLTHLLSLLPRLAAETARLLEHNTRLQRELSRAQLELSELRAGQGTGQGTGVGTGQGTAQGVGQGVGQGKGEGKGEGGTPADAPSARRAGAADEGWAAAAEEAAEGEAAAGDGEAAAGVAAAGEAAGDLAGRDESEMLFQVRIDEGDGEREVVVTREQLASLMASSSQAADDDVDAVLGATEEA